MAAAGKGLAVAATIRELLTGREKAARLGNLLRRRFVDGEGVPDEARELVEDLHASFSNALAALESGDSPEACRGSAAAAGESSLCSEEGRAAGKRRSGRPGGADRRGGQRRRSQSESWTVPAATLDDGHTWRKYGQKGIQSAKHPRSYFRCSHKHDRGCKAKRQVQRSEEDPSTYLITYSGHHTCTAAAAAPNSAQPAAGGPFLINFGGSPGESLQVVGGAHAAAAAAAAKQDSVEEDAASNLSRHGSSLEYLLLAPEPGTLGADPVWPPATASVSDLGDGSSGSCLDVDLGVDSFPFGDIVSYLNDVQFDLRFP